jgi:hypothetical protein
VRVDVRVRFNDGVRAGFVSLDVPVDDAHAEPHIHDVALGLAAQVEIESKTLKQSDHIVVSSAKCSRRFQHGFDGVNLHRPTLAAQITFA